MPSALVYIGGVNRGIGYVANAAAEGIAAFEIDLDSGASRALGVTRGIDNPTYLALSPDGGTLVAVSEVDGWHEGVVSCYRVDPSNGVLRYCNKQPSRGDYTCHTGFDPTGRFVGVANYGGMPITELPNRSFALYTVDEELSPPCAQVTHAGQGADAIRQTRPHAHCVRWSPDGRFLIVSDLGIDRLVVYRFDAVKGAVEPHGEVALTPGAGPRHVLFHPSLPILYCVNELDGTLVTMAFDAASGNLRPLATASTLPEAGYSGNACSALAISKTGDHVYVGNRGHDSVACLVTDTATGIASFQSTTPSGGSVPRDIAFDPSGTTLAVANQESDHVALFRRDASTGALSALGPGIDVGSPTVIAFHPELR
jgi:6-phosphogluconolactonase